MSGSPLQLCHILPRDMVVKSFLAETGRGMLAARLIIVLVKGLGDLPDNLAWLRPFGITGAVTLEHPMTGSSINFGIDERPGS